MQTLGFSSKIYVKVWKYRPEGVATDATPSAHTSPAICPENIIKPTKALQISQNFYDYAD